MSLKNKRKQDRKSVVICGAYGMDNAGDEAILEAIVSEMREIDISMPISVLSRKPEETAKRLSVKSMHTFNIAEFMKSLKTAKLYINGGGSLIQDVTSRRSLWYYLLTIVLAKKLGANVMMYGCGIGPVLHKGDISLTRFVLNRYVDAITLREPDSMAMLEDFGVTKPKIVLASDPALILKPAEDAKVDELFNKHNIPLDGAYVCYGLRRWQNFEQKAEAVAKSAVHAYEKHGLTPLFISINHANDSDASRLVIERLGDIPYYNIEEALPTELSLGIMERMKLVVSMRLHGLIFAAGVGTAVVGISYDPKVTAFMRCVESSCEVLEDLSAEILCEHIDLELEKGTSHAKERVKRLRDLESKNTDLARELLM